jgi:large subunit ribosomal protein L5
VARLKHQYYKTTRARLQERMKIANPFAVPRLRKITVSCGVGKGKENKKLFDHAVNILTRITGQKAVVTVARKSVAQFKLREGMNIGAMVTLRGDRAYEFLDRLIQVVIPRIRDFRGLPRQFDGRGNYNMGLSEQTVFPEVDGELLEHVQGMNIAISISGGSDDRSRALLEEFSFPFRPAQEANVG